MHIGPQELVPLLAQHRDYLRGAGGQQLDLSGKAFVDCDFGGETLHGIVGARAAVFTRCNFAHADLYGISFQDSTIVACDFTASMLSKCEFWGVTISDSTFNDAVLIRAEFSGAIISDTRFAGANLLGGVVADSSLTRCVFDGADVTGAAISGNREIDVSWQNVTGLIAKADAATTAAPDNHPSPETLLFAVVDQLTADAVMPLDAAAKALNTTLHAAGETAYIRSFSGDRDASIASGPALAFTNISVRQNKIHNDRIMLIAQLADTVCIQRDRVLRKLASSGVSPTLTPPSPQSGNSQAYISFTFNRAKVSFGFTQDKPDRVASLTIDRTEPS